MLLRLARQAGGVGVELLGEELVFWIELERLAPLQKSFGRFAEFSVNIADVVEHHGIRCFHRTGGEDMVGDPTPVEAGEGALGHPRNLAGGGRPGNRVRVPSGAAPSHRTVGYL